MDQEPLAVDSPRDSNRIPAATIAKMAVAALVIAAVVTFVLQNLDNVNVDFLSFNFETPLILLLAIAAVIGVPAKWLFGFWRSRRKS